MERKVKLIFIFMKHSFRSLSLSGPLHPFIYDASGETSPLYFALQLSPPPKISRWLCSQLVLLPFIFMLTFSFLSASEQEVFQSEARVEFLEWWIMIRSVIPPRVSHRFFIARPNYSHRRMQSSIFVSLVLSSIKIILEHKNYVCTINCMHKVYYTSLFIRNFVRTNLTSKCIACELWRNEASECTFAIF